MYYCSENSQSSDFTGCSSGVVDPLRTHKFCCEKMAQCAADSTIVAFPFPWADSEFHSVRDYCLFFVYATCILAYVHKIFSK